MVNIKGSDECSFDDLYGDTVEKHVIIIQSDASVSVLSGSELSEELTHDTMTGNARV